MIKLKSVTLWGFRGLVERQTVDFSSGMWLLDGLNQDTGGGSAAGKTSLLLAITYALGICPFSASDLQSWYTDEPFGVELTLEGDLPIVLRRSAKSAHLQVGKEEFKSATAVDKALATLLGHQKTLLSALTYRQQDEPGLFLRKTNGEKLRFLIEVLGLQKAEADQKQSAERIKKAEQAVGVSQAEMAIHKSTLQGLQDAPQSKQAETPTEPLVEQIEATKGSMGVLAGIIGQLEGDLVLLREKEDQKIRAINQQHSEKYNALKEEMVVCQTKDKISTPDDGQVNVITADLTKLRGIIQDRKGVLALEAVRREREVAQLDKELADNRKRLSVLDSYAESLPGLEKRLETLKNNTCPTCSRQWDDAAQEMEAVTGQINTINNSLLDRQVLVAKIAYTTASISTLRKTPEDPGMEEYVNMEKHLIKLLAEEKSKIQTRAQIEEAEFNGKKAEIHQRLAELETATANEIAEVRKELRTQKYVDEILEKRQELKNRENVLHRGEDQLHYVIQNNKTVRDAIEWHGKSMAEANMKMLVASDVVVKAIKALEAEQDYQEMVHGWLQGYVGEVLEQLSAEVNKMLSSVPNTQTTTIRFMTERETQEGTTRQEITPLITINGHEAKLKSGLSGGMIAVVDMAVDLAMAKIIEERTGHLPGWLLLDECLDGLGPIEKEAALEILRKYSGERTVLVIDHASEFKELFAHTVLVSSQGGISSLSVS